MKTLRKTVSLAYAALLALTGRLNALATDIANSKLTTGTQKLIEDATTWLLVLAPIIGTVCIIYFAIRRGAAEQQEQKQWQDRIIAAIVSVAIAILASVIVKVIVSYYS